MRGLLETLLRAESGQRLFARGAQWITAGEIRAMAADAAPRLPNGTIFLHTASTAHFVAGLLAAASRGAMIALPAHTQAGYLSEIGCADRALVTDDFFKPAGADAALDIENLDPLLIFFTSGSTGAPKEVEKNLSRLETEARELDALWGHATTHTLATVSHQHIYGLLFRIMWPLLSGRTADDEAAAYWEDVEGRIAGATLISSPAL